MVYRPRYRRRGNDLPAFHSLWVGKAGGELQRNRLSAAARFRRRGNDLRAFHSLWVGKAGGELLRGSPPLSGASVLSASRLEPLAPFPLPSPARFSRSIQEPGRASRCLHAGCRSVGIRTSSELIPEEGSPPGFDIA